MRARRCWPTRSTVAPKPHFLNWQQDPQGNFLARVVFPEKVTQFDVTVDLIADMATVNPFDFFLEPQAETWPFAYDPVLEQELAPFRRTEPVGTAAGRAARRGAARHAAHRRYAGRAEPHGAATHRLHRAAGAGRLAAGADARRGPRQLPRFRVAAGAVAAQPRLRRALRLRLPDPACRRREAAGGAGRAERRLHRPARLGRGLSARRRLDRAGCHLRPAGGRGPHPARRQPRAAIRRADLRPGRAVRSRASTSPCRSGACRKPRA